jgi:hypothetical protein
MADDEKPSPASAKDEAGYKEGYAAAERDRQRVEHDVAKAKRIEERSFQAQALEKAQKNIGVVAGSLTMLGGEGAGAASPGIVAAGSLNPIVAVAASSFAAGAIVMQGAETSLTWNRNQHLLEGIEVDLQDRSNLRTLAKQMHTKLDAAGVTKNAQGEYDFTNATNADKMHTLLLARKGELEMAAKKTDKELTMHALNPFSLDPIPGDKFDDRFNAMDQLARVNAAGIELADLAQKAMQAPSPEAAKAAAKNVLSDKGIKGGQHVTDASTPPAGGGKTVAAKSLPPAGH